LNIPLHGEGCTGALGGLSIAAYIAYGRINPIAADRRALGMSTVAHRQIAHELIKLLRLPPRVRGERELCSIRALPKSADGADIVAPSWFPS
jgi:hypothetical protein